METIAIKENNIGAVKYFTNDPLYLSIFLYCLLQPVCRIWAKRSGFYETRKDLCKKIMAAYNLAMTVFSLVCAVTVLYCLFNLENGVFTVGHYDDKNYEVFQKAIIFMA